MSLIWEQNSCNLSALLKIYLSFNIQLIIFIINGCWQHSFPLISLGIYPYWPQHLVTPLDGIQCPHSGNEFRPLLVNKHCVFLYSSQWKNVVYEFVLISPQCLVYLAWMVCVMGARWTYSCCFCGGAASSI